MSCESCEKNVNTMYIYSFVTFFLIISPLVSNSTKLGFFFYSIPLLSFTVMFIINPPYHNRKHKRSRDGMTGRKNGKRTIQAKVSIDFTWLVWILLFSCTHLKKKIKFKISPYCTGIIVKVYMYYFIYTLQKIHHYESES